MARINIEDSIFKDRRFLKLIRVLGCEYKALGYISSAWILAQENWLKHNCIPHKAWPKDLDILIEVELAERTLTGDIYIKGSKNAFKWLEQKSNAGKSKTEKKIKNLKKTPNVRSSGVNGGERGSNGAEPLTLTPSLTLTLSQDNNTLEQNKFARYDFDAIYKKYPRKLGKSEGLRKCKVQIKSPEDYEDLKKAVDNYAKYCVERIENEKFIKHFSSFMSVWRDWIEMPEANKDFSKNDDVFALLREEENATTVL